MNGHEVEYLGKRIEALSARIDQYERMHRELLERITRMEASVNSAATLLKWMIPVVLTSAGLFVTILFWLIGNGR